MERRIPWIFGSLAATIAALVLVAPTTAGAQDYTVQLNSYNGPATVYVSRTAIRKTEPGFKTDVIYRLAENKIITIDHEQKTYSEVTVAQERQINAQATATLSPQLQAMRSRLGLNNPPSFTTLGPGDTIAGYATEKYEIKTPAMTMEIWAAPALSIPPAYYEVFRIGAGPGSGFVGGTPIPSREALKKITGMILKRVITTTLLNGTTLTEEATAVTTSPIPTSTFAPPAGYTKVVSES